MRQLGGSANNAELLSSVIEFLHLSTHLVDILHSGGPQTELDYRLAWAKTYLKRDGLIDNSRRGVWSLTHKGAGIRDPESLNLAGSANEESLAWAQPDSRGLEAELDADNAWKTELLRVLGELDPDAFERLCQRLLRESGSPT